MASNSPFSTSSCIFILFIIHTCNKVNSFKFLSYYLIYIWVWSSPSASGNLLNLSSTRSRRACRYPRFLTTTINTIPTTTAPSNKMADAVMSCLYVIGCALWVTVVCRLSPEPSPKPSSDPSPETGWDLMFLLGVAIAKRWLQMKT